MSRKLLTIWFNKNGDMISLAHRWLTSGGDHFSEVGEDFDDTLVFHKMYEYKTARVYFKSKTNGRYYCMFLDHFGELLRLGKLNNNEITGKFRFTKRGQGQGIKMVLDAHDEHQLEQIKKDAEERTRWF